MEKLKVMLCVGEKKEQNCCLNYHHVMNIKIRFNAFYSARSNNNYKLLFNCTHFITTFNRLDVRIGKA